MNIRQQKQPSKKSKLFIPIVVLVALVVGGILGYNLPIRQTLADNAASSVSFEFDASKAPGWWAGDNMHPSSTPDAQNSTTKLPTARRIIAQGTRQHPTGDCFVMYSYWADDSKDLTEALNEAVASSDTSSPSSLKLEPTVTANYTMRTPVGDTPLEIHQYNLTGELGQEMSRGAEFGFLKVGTGYISIKGYCKTAEQLSVTKPVFSAVSFKQ